jgi:hypothetical protein
MARDRAKISAILICSICFPARRQKSTSQSIEPSAIDGKSLSTEKVCSADLCSRYTPKSRRRNAFQPIWLPKSGLIRFGALGKNPDVTAMLRQFIGNTGRDSG